MSRKSDNYPLVFIGGSLGFWLLFHAAWNILFEDWFKHQVERWLGHTVAEMIERFGAVGFPALAAIGLVWYLLRYAKAHYGEAAGDDSAIEAQRQTAAAILAHAEAIKLSIPLPKVDSAEISDLSLGGADPLSPTSSDVWKVAPEAVEAFAESELIEVRNKQAELFHEGYMSLHEAEDKIREIQNKFENWHSLDANTPEGRTLGANQRRVELNKMQISHSGDELRRAWDALRADIESKLTRGYLIGGGFRSPHVAGSAETEISMAEWRILDLNNVTSEATKKGSNDVLYSGVVLRRAD